MLVPRAAALDGDHRRHDRRGGRRTLKICRRSNAPPHVRVFLFFTSSSNSIASAITRGGSGIYTCELRHAGPRTYAPTSHSPHPARAPARALRSRMHAIAVATRAPDAVHSSRSLASYPAHTHADTHTHAYTWARTHAPNLALVRVRRAHHTRSRAPTRQARHGLFPAHSS